MIQPLTIKMKVVLFIIIGVIVLILINKLQKKSLKKMHEEFVDDIKNESTEKEKDVRYKSALLTEEEKKSAYKYKAYLTEMKQYNDNLSQKLTLENIKDISYLIYNYACSRLNIQPYSPIELEELTKEEKELEQLGNPLDTLKEDEELDFDKLRAYTSKEKAYTDRLLASSHRFTEYDKAIKYLKNYLAFSYKIHMTAIMFEDRIEEVFDNLIVSAMKKLESK